MAAESHRGPPVDAAAIVGEAGIGRFQLTAIGLCAVVALFDGFDTQAIAFAAPAIAREWGLASSVFGPVFSAALAGLALGALTFGTLADRVGRRLVIIGSTLVFGLFSLATARADSLTELIILRFLTGLGLGGAIPNIIALTNEYSPRRLRVLIVATMAAGFPLGGFFGGLASAGLISAHGWQAVFVAGGVLPLLLVPVLWFKLPESIPFLLRRGDALSAALAARYVAEIGGTTVASAAEMTFRQEVAPRAGVGQLFTRERVLSTLMLWLTFFTNLLMFYFLISWIPSVLADTGLKLNLAITVGAVLNAGTVLGGVVLGHLIDRWGPFKILSTNYLAAAAFTILIGLPGESLGLLFALTFMAGFAVGGGQLAIVGFAASFYPTEIRSTGVGWAFGIGRLGAVAGPIAGGLLLGYEVGRQGLFLACGLPGLVAAVAVFLMWRRSLVAGRGR